MSKNLLTITALSVLFLILASVSYAQEDSEGIVPADETQPPANQQLQEEPVQTREERLQTLRDKEAAAYESAKERYVSVLQNPVDDVSDNYKLNFILTSARYHKLVDLYYSYLIKIERSFSDSTTGFEIVGPDDELNRMEEKIIAVSSALEDLDFTVSSISGVTEAELPAITPELFGKSSEIKLQLIEVKTDMLDLVDTIE